MLRCHITCRGCRSHGNGHGRQGERTVDNRGIEEPQVLDQSAQVNGADGEFQQHLTSRPRAARVQEEDPARLNLRRRRALEYPTPICTRAYCVVARS